MEPFINRIAISKCAHGSNPLQSGKKHGEVYWEIHLQSPLIDYALYDMFDLIYTKRYTGRTNHLTIMYNRRDHALATSHRSGRSKHRVDMIVQYITGAAKFEVATLEASVPEDKAHQQEDILKLGKEGANILNDLLTRRGSWPFVVPLLQPVGLYCFTLGFNRNSFISGLDLVLYTVSSPWGGTFLFTRYAACRMPSECSTFAHVQEIGQCAELVMVFKVK